MKDCLDSADAILWLMSPAAIRCRCQSVLAAGQRGELAHFAIAEDRLEDAADVVVELTRERFPALDVPMHSRWRHFAAGGPDRWQQMADGLDAVTTAERARIRIDLVTISVLLDAGAGAEWRYFDAATGFMLIDSLLSGQEGAFASTLSHLVLPTIVLGTIPLAVIARQTRSAMLEVLNEDYVRTARAKGLAPLRAIGLHALRNALIPVVTVIGLQVGVLFAGAVLTETIFAWPGIGKWLIDSISRRDYPSVQGGILLIATTVIIVNLAVDLLYGLINPRIRHKNTP